MECDAAVLQCPWLSGGSKACRTAGLKTLAGRQEGGVLDRPVTLPFPALKPDKDQR